MRDYFAELTEETGLIPRGPDFRHIYLDTAGPEPALPARYVAPYPLLTRDERATINQTNTCRAIQGRPDLTNGECANIISRVNQPGYIPIP